MGIIIVINYIWLQFAKYGSIMQLTDEELPVSKVEGRLLTEPLTSDDFKLSMELIVDGVNYENNFCDSYNSWSDEKKIILDCYHGDGEAHEGHNHSISHKAYGNCTRSTRKD